MAPEVANDDANYNEKSDIWSLGIILLGLLDINPNYFIPVDRHRNKKNMKPLISNGQRDIPIMLKCLVGKMLLKADQRICLGQLKAVSEHTLVIVKFKL